MGPFDPNTTKIHLNLIFRQRCVLIKILANPSNCSSSSIGLIHSQYYHHPHHQQQINHELNASYFYTALGTYYSQPTVALPGVANYFLAQSNEERRHAHALIQYQNGRGGKVQFSAIQAPPDFSKVLTGGEASSAAAAPQNMKNSSCDTVGCTNNIATVTTRGFELAIETERMVYDKIRYIYQVAESQRDFALTGFLQKLIDEQVESLRELQELYTKSKRMVNEYWFDQYLVNSSVASSVESGATEFKSGSAQ